MASAIFAQAVEQYREIRSEFELVLNAAYLAAEEATNGNLLNARGRAKGIDAWSLFFGPAIRAEAYASEDLKAYWAEHPRTTFEQFEAQSAQRFERSY